MELSGRWVATVADDDVRRFGLGLDADDHDWHPIAVPGHWQHAPRFADSDGPIMYRHRFSCAPPADGRRRWITFDGVMYQADAWLDGAYLGDPEGYFFPHTFDVTVLTRIGDEHVLAVEVACSDQQPAARSNITGILQAWRGLPAGWNPGGLWRSVRMFDTGPVRIDRLRVLCRDADERRAHVLFSAHLDSDDVHDVVVRTLRDDEVVDVQRPGIAAGRNEIEWSLDITRPDLWWPRELGEQHLTTFTIEVVVDGEPSDQRQRRIGIRHVDWNNWICTVNGERVYLRGANLLPVTVGIGDTTDDLIERDLELALDLGLNALRVRGHISRRCLYDRADELGLLIVQDFPLEGPQSRSVRARATQQAAAAVDTIGHHPSVVLWSGHNEPTDIDAPPGSGWRQRTRAFVGRQLPSWNRSVLDRWVKRSFERADASRPTSAYSGVGPHLPRLDGTDRHLWFGWHHGEATDLAARARRLPSTVRFVSEFGAESVPSSVGFLDDIVAAARWPQLDWEGIEQRFGYDRATFEAIFPPQEYDSLDDWRRTTQHYQSYVLKTQIETLRRLKYRPTGGFCFSSLADPTPTISASVYDHERVAKDAAAVVRAACQPVIVVADPLADWVNPADRLDVDVHLVNDRRETIDDAEVTATVTWPGGSRIQRFGGPVDADTVIKVGTVRIDVPDTLGELAVELVATAAGKELARNRYTTAVVVPTS